MFIPKPFKVTDNDEIYSFIEENSFGQIISYSEGGLSSSHIPFLLSEDKTNIFGHLAKQNPQAVDLDGSDVLITLEGPHDYISPSWYSSPGVPTWNYQAVHIYGRARTFSNTDKLKSIVDTLTKKYESGFEEPWLPNYQAAMLGGIVGVDVEVRDIQCKYKLSQNRSLQDQSQVIDKLNGLGSKDLAKAMEQNKNT